MSMIKQISVKLTDEEYDALCDICQDKLTMSGAVRLLIMSAEKGCLFIPADQRNEFDALYKKYSGGKK